MLLFKGMLAKEHMIQKIVSCLTEMQRRYNIGFLLYFVSVFILFISTYSEITPWYFIYLPLLLALAQIMIGALRSLWRLQLSNDFFFIAAAVIGVIADEVHAIVVVLLILLMADYFEHLIEERTQESIESLIEYLPSEVIKVVDGEEKVISIDELSIGDRILIKTGSRIPIDGVIVDGSAEINEAVLTGESMPVYKKENALVFAGTYVVSGSVLVEANKIGLEQTKFGKIAQLMTEAREQKSHITTFAARIAGYVTVGFAVFIALVWFVMGDLEVVVSLLVFGSPIELLMVTPLTIFAGIAVAFRQGVIVKGGAALESLARASVMGFDKTGTLTIGEPVVVQIQSLHDDYIQKDILYYAAIAEKRSGHAVAKAVQAKADEEGLSVPDPSAYRSLTGHGVEVVHEGKRYLVGNRHFIEAPEHGNVSLEGVKPCAAAYSTLYIAQDSRLCGIICIADEIRADAQEAIQSLRMQGISSMLIMSGDRQEIADEVAQKLGIEKAFGEVMPEEKLERIRKLQDAGYVVAMVGDGINDAPALQQASVGIAMGAMGMEPAIEAADIVLMSNDLRLLVFVHHVSQQALRIIKQNIIWGLFLTHGLGIALGILKILRPIQAAFFHAIPELLIFLNTARLLRERPER